MGPRFGLCSTTSGMMGSWWPQLTWAQHGSFCRRPSTTSSRAWSGRCRSTSWPWRLPGAKWRGNWTNPNLEQLDRSSLWLAMLARPRCTTSYHCLMLRRVCTQTRCLTAWQAGLPGLRLSKLSKPLFTKPSHTTPLMMSTSRCHDQWPHRTAQPLHTTPLAGWPRPDQIAGSAELSCPWRAWRTTCQAWCIVRSLPCSAAQAPCLIESTHAAPMQGSGQGRLVFQARGWQLNQGSCTAQPMSHSLMVMIPGKRLPQYAGGVSPGFSVGAVL